MSSLAPPTLIFDAMFIDYPLDLLSFLKRLRVVVASRTAFVNHAGVDGDRPARAVAKGVPWQVAGRLATALEPLGCGGVGLEMINLPNHLSLRLIVALLPGCVASAALAVPAPTAPVAAAQAIGEQALRAAAADDQTRAFYQRHGWTAVWTDTAAEALVQALAGRSAHGLDRVAFLADQSSSDPAQREVALTRAAIRYAAALAHGVTDPTALHQIYTLARPEADLAGPLDDAIAHGMLGQWFAGLAPQDGTYTMLSNAYAAAVQQAQDGGDSGMRIAASDLIHVGDRDDRVPDIVAQLIQSEYLPASDDAASGAAASAPADRYTPRIADAVRQLQQDYGIVRDGVVGPDTVALLNLRPSDRVRALAVALERRRWLARTPPATRIDVNIAAARLRYFRDGELVDSRRVIVGKPGKETPLLMAPIYRLVANPTWTIPKSIENSELADVGSDYLRRHNMVRRNGFIVQQPGPDNALGLVKFDMLDDQAIYLHDTGSPALFERSQRHLSHGCVRVDDALGFALMLAEDAGVADAWQQARDGGEQQFVDLPQRLPVRLLYQNVDVDDAGKVAFQADPYDWNGPVAAALGFDTGKTRTRANAETVDVGP